MQVAGDVGRWTRPTDRGEFGGGQHPVDGAGKRGERTEARGGGEYCFVFGIGGTQRAVGGDAGEEVAEPERPQHQHDRPDGGHPATSVSSRSQSPRKRASP